VTQNVYDDPAFFEGYAKLERSRLGLEAAPEWPALRALLPPVPGARVLDLGCGYGWFCRWARAAGAAQVLGVDVSERMLQRARADTAGPGITYLRADLEQPDLPPGAFDLAYASLSLHYVSALDRLLASVHQRLAPGGSLVFSVEHPLLTAPDRAGWIRDADGRAIWPVRGYLDEGARSVDWIVPGVVKRHRTVATYVNLLIGAGFTVGHLEEWGPSEEQVAARPEWAIERERPFFLLAAARR
jgi:SAM-dependent methyltransferase